MKINQLFSQKVSPDVVQRLIECFGLKNLEDRKSFSKQELVQLGTVDRLNAMKPDLETYYLPCKAKVYLSDLTEKKTLTVLKQVLRLHGYCVQSYERNMNHKKVIFYRLMNEQERVQSNQMRFFEVTHILSFE